MITYRNAGPAGPAFSTMSVKIGQSSAECLAFAIQGGAYEPEALLLNREQLQHLCVTIKAFLDSDQKSEPDRLIEGTLWPSPLTDSVSATDPHPDAD